ncbi:protein FAR1-RELATED SEQUENCE 5-like [Tasmannia lanceolata]|uniref:protein FAR1-RELATED SEQUENCE 5-like n=1 Tax=Tasmannia lanceolata TaxID=3420 RepID=UPI00406280CC
MDSSNELEPCVLSIDQIDANMLLLIEDTMSEAEGVNEKVGGDEVVMVEGGGNLNEATLVEGDNDVRCGGNFSTPIKDDSQSNARIVPFVGLEFENEVAAHQYYNLYALVTGFGIWKAKTATSKKDIKVVIWRRFVCDKEGFRSSNDKRQAGKKVKVRRHKREGCEAKLEISLKNGKWVVTAFQPTHCHALTSPDRIRLHRSHNGFHKSNACKNLIDLLRDSGLPPAGIARAINESCKGSDAQITTNQVVSRLRIRRQNNMGREAVIVAEHFQKKRSEDPNFFFSMELDEVGNLRSMFWADARARTAYLTFTDVIVFDVTYKTNRYQMPFAPFTGVNHHRQSALFGCALLADEKEEKFTWLFEQWLRCMFGKAPGCIITDMDGAMRNAIQSVFPSTRHRFCYWHIKKHLVEHIPAFRDPTSDFEKDYSHWFYRKTISDSEMEWKKMVQKYNIGEKDWIAKMWESRSHWVPVYFRGTFTAGMVSSSRSESINAFFDGFVNQNTTLQEFVQQYDRALVARRKSESQEDFNTKSTKVVLKGKNRLEAQAGDFYTRALFTIFQTEFTESIDLWEDETCKNGNVTEYIVGFSDDPIWKWSKVVYEESKEGVKATCACAKFEIEGILCRHILRIMTLKRLTSIPARYILHRWSIGARYHVGGGVPTGEEDSDDATPLQKWCLIGKHQRLLEEMQSDKSLFKKMNEAFDAWLAECEQNKLVEQISMPCSGSQVHSNFIRETPEIVICDPKVVRGKGRPKKATRHKSPLELSQTQRKRKKCGICGLLGHYQTTCKKKMKVWITANIFLFFPEIFIVHGI